MPTDFLNRRMDLLHNRDNLVDTLTMDTSYPVRLAGKVIKIFTASYDYEARNFNICNSEKETILIINTSNIYDFAGRVLMNSVGDGKAYPTNADVFKTGDYVMAVIDFDNNSMHLCSQTNFEKFITGNIDTGEKCKFKLFDITGDTKITFEDGTTRSIDPDKFQEAINFEAQEDDEYHSFLRCNEDNVIFENPSIYKSDKNTKYYMTPVSNVDTLNINSINTSIQNFFFPIINSGGFDFIDGFRIFQTINGLLNQKFIEEFCYTYQEIQRLPIFGKTFYINTEVDSIVNDKNSYYYVLSTDSAYNDQYSTIMKDSSGNPLKDENGNLTTESVLSSDLRFIPIKKDTMKFSSYMDSNGGTIKCSDINIAIPISLSAGSRHLYIGNWWSDDKNFGYTVWKYTNDRIKFGILLEYNNNNNIKKNINITGSYVYNYKQYHETKNFNDEYVISTNCDVEKCYENNQIMKYINRFVDFFAPKYDQESINYNYAIKEASLTQTNSSNNHHLGIKNCDSSITPFCTVIIYPEIFEDVLYGKDTSTGDFAHKDENIRNFTGFYDNNYKLLSTDINRKNYKIPNLSIDGYENVFLVYSLFDLNKTKEKLYINNSDKPSTVNLKDWLKDEFKENELIYRANQTVLGDSNTNMICKISSECESDTTKKLMLTCISKLKVGMIGESNKKDTTYNNAQIKHQNFLVARLIMTASDVITYENNTYNITYNGQSYQLYTVINKGANKLEMTVLDKSNFKNTGSNTVNIMYLYFRDNNNSIFSVKYYYNITDTNSSESKINNFDYISCVEILPDLTTKPNESTIDSYSRFLNSLLNIYINEGKTIKESIDYYYDLVNSSAGGWMNQVIKVIKTYHMYPYNLTSTETPNVILNSSALGITNTSNIYVGGMNLLNNENTMVTYYHENIYYGAWINNSEKLDGFRLRDMIGNDYSIYQNCMVPYVSNTLSDNGSKIYSISTYNKVLKDTSVSSLFDTREFPFLGCKGIRECYYVNKSLYDFYNYIFTRDLSKDINDPDSLIKNKISSSNRAFFSRSEVNKISKVELIYDEEINEWINHLKDSNDKDIIIKAGLTLHANIDSNAILGFNNSKLYNYDSVDVSDDYTVDEPILINKEQSGDKTTYSLSMNSGDTNNPSIVPLNGSDEDIETDKLNWLTLLTALNNNKTIDLLESALIKIKKDLKNYIIQEGQNISDIYSIEDEERTITKANAHDNVWPEDSEYYKEKNAEFDKNHNIYDFNYGYGYISGESSNNDTRELKNRGVIVFVIEGGSVNRITYGQDDPNKFTYNLTEGNIRTKRMYISKDGVICTKEYYDRESSSDGFKSNPKTSINDLQSRITALEQRISNLESNS